MYLPKEIDLSKILDDVLNLDEVKKLTIKAWNDNISNIKKLNSEQVELEKGDYLLSGDIVTLNISSNIDRFNRSEVIVSLGLGLYCLDLENKLVGERLGDEVKISFVYQDNIYSADIKLLSAKRNIIKDIDATSLKKRLEMDNLPTDISTFNEYEKAWCEREFILQIKDKFLERAFLRSSLELFDKSNIEVDREILDYLEKSFNTWRDGEISNGISELDFYKEYFGQNISDIEEGKKAFSKQIDKQAKLTTYAKKLAESENIVVDRQEYMKNIEEYAKLENKSVEDIMKISTFESFEYGIYTSNLSKMLIRELNKYIVDRGIKYEG